MLVKMDNTKSIEIENVDIVLLQEQKLILASISDLTAEQQTAVDGIVNLLDNITDNLLNASKNVTK